MAEAQRIITEQCVDDQGRLSTRTYVRQRFLGKGGFARCYEVVCNTTGAKFAGKIVEKASLVKTKARLKFSSEIRIHKMLLHPRVVEFKHYFEDESNCYMLLELCTHQSLSDLLRRRKRLTEHEVRYYIKQLVEGIAYLHSKCVIHRDLKLGNLFLSSDMQLKIGDFGLASLLDSREEKRRTMCGTPNYIAPEILNGHHNNGHSFEVDIWSTGVVMYTLLVGKPPFETKDVKNTYKLIRAIEYTFPSDVSISASAKSLIMDFLQKDPLRRPTIASIQAHPFLTNEPIPQSLPDSAMFVAPPITHHLTSQKRSPLATLDDTRSNRRSPPPVTSPKPSAPEPDVLDVMAHNLSTAFFLAASDNSENVIGQEILQAKLEVDETPIEPATLWVLQYVDYTSKYGLGYLLSNQCTGVYFNDATKIVSSSAIFGYIDRPKGEVEVPQVTHPLSHYPPELTKKVTLVGHFKEYMEGDDCPESKMLQSALLLSLPAVINPMVYVSKWQKAKHSIMFRLSNDTMQVNFFDQTKLVLSHGGKVVTYLDKAGQLHAVSIYDAILTRNQPDLLKRLKYAKDMLQQMVVNAKAA